MTGTFVAASAVGGRNVTVRVDGDRVTLGATSHREGDVARECSGLSATSPLGITTTCDGELVELRPVNQPGRQSVAWVTHEGGRIDGEGLVLLWSRPVLYLMRDGVVALGPVWWPTVRTLPGRRGEERIVTVEGDGVSWRAARSVAVKAGCVPCGGRR